MYIHISVCRLVALNAPNVRTAEQTHPGPHCVRWYICIWTHTLARFYLTCLRTQGATGTDSVAVASPAVASELICFHSKRTHEEDIIGLPIAVPNRMLRDISSPLELLSYTSFKEGTCLLVLHHKYITSFALSFAFIGVRKSVYGEAFEHFLPLYVNASHGARSRDVLKRSLQVQCGRRLTDAFDPMCAIHVIPKVRTHSHSCTSTAFVLTRTRS